MKKLTTTLFFIFCLFISTSLGAANNTSSTSTTKNAYFAGGCFWGVEYHFEKQKGVKDAISGYMGGMVQDPNYFQVIRGNTGHLEAVKVVYNPNIISYEKLAKLFFEIHDMEQTNGQGPDIGNQYLSAIFYNNKEEKKTSEKLIGILSDKGYKVATSLYKANKFFDAESYHQNYYERKGGTPYCHSYKKIF